MTTITLPEESGIKQVRGLHEEARKAIKAGPDCTMDFASVRRVDCSVAQVVLSLQRECERKGGNCSIMNANEETERLLAYVGVK